MYLFRWYPETLASSLRSSMVYMCVTLIVPSPLRQFWPRFFPDHFG
jgi:hypothetical protein